MSNASVRSSWHVGLIVLTALLWPLSSLAASCPALPPKPEACRKVADAGQRLDCYDHAVDGTPWPSPCTCLRRDGFSLHLQATTGYGDTLLDYNHRQTTLGIGVAFGGRGE